MHRIFQRLRQRLSGLHSYRRHILLALGLLVTGSSAALYLLLLADLPPAHSAEARLVRPTTTIVDRNGRMLYEVLDPETGKQLNLRLDDIPPACIQATIATEDGRFFLHPGFDPLAIARAAWQNFRGRTVVSGGSTLTQQLARNLLLPPGERYEQTIRRKIREVWLAWQLERIYTKDELLALYLNQTYFGNFAFGLEAAAQVFFAKPAAHLSRGECAVLIGLIQYPSGYNPLLNPDTAKERQLTVLRLMREANYINDADAELIAAEPLRYRSQLFDIRAPHFVMFVQDLALQRVGLDRLRAGGLRIVTSLDLDLQLQAERALRYRIDLLNCRMPGLCDATTDPNRRVDNAAAVILDAHSGDILSMVGSPNYFDAQIRGNVNAALAMRQPGSAIKPLTYAAALDPLWMEPRGLSPMTPATILPDLPAIFYVRDDRGGNVPYQPVNYNRRYHGPVSVRTALASSYNIPAVRVLDAIGVETLQQLASAAGITTFTREAGLALTLGGGEVRLLDLATAFGIFQDGRRLDTRAILDIQVQDNDGTWRSLLGIDTPGALPAQRASSGRAGGVQVISPAAAYLVTDILADVIARAPAFGSGSVLELPFPAAVKTGTTTDWRDNWTVGYSTQRIVGVWVGNADNTPMLDVSGIDGAGPIWNDLMRLAHPVSPPPFTRPPGLVDIEICAPSGLLPTPECSRVRSERFIAGTQPTQTDDQFQRIAVDLATGSLATADTPSAQRGERVYWVLPPLYHDWMASQGLPMPPVAPQASLPAVGTPLATDAGGPLVLTAPTSHTAYTIHPGVPGERQRIQVAGYSADGTTWAALRLVKDGVILAEANNASRLSTWWVFAPGMHYFWIEGEAGVDGPTLRTQPSLVEVGPGHGQTVAAEEALIEN